MNTRITLAVGLTAIALSLQCTQADASRRHHPQARQAPAITCDDRFGCSDRPAAVVREAVRERGGRSTGRKTQDGRQASPAPSGWTWRSPAASSQICRNVYGSALVRSINAKLARWLRPTGNCPAGTNEVVATYYSRGSRTATGARFHPDGVSAAHLTLPFGTMVNVTNPRNGRTVTVPINDRGPCTDASIDLSRGAARALGTATSIPVCVSGASFAGDVTRPVQ